MWREDPAHVRPMLATTTEASLQSAAYAYELKYDGMRALAAIQPARSGAAVRMWSRLGNEKTKQFAEITDALSRWGSRLSKPVVIDGEITAVDRDGHPISFQNLQQRIHLQQPRAAASRPSTTNRRRASRPPDPPHQPHSPTVAYFMFDLLREGTTDLRGLPLRERRARLERLLATLDDERLHISEQVVGDGRGLHERAVAQGWEGLIAKRLDSTYASGRRSSDWRKVKLVRHQTCVVGGWTEPRGTRPFFGALLLGVYDPKGSLQYVGHSGAGFSDAELARVWKLLGKLRAGDPPFVNPPKGNERPHWVKPKLVAEVKFTEWTSDGKLRHPTYLGLRDDVLPESVRREPEGGHVRRTGQPGRGGRVGNPGSPNPPSPPYVSSLLQQLDEIESHKGNGTLQLPDGDRLEVGNLGKTFWPALKLTKGDLLRHYVRVSAAILPVLADRPLVMKRFPNGVEAGTFYQHRAPDKFPPGVRVAVVSTESETRSRIIGGSLKTLLYTAQLASISQDPWFSRVGSEDAIDYVAIDLDPPDDLPFSNVLDVARWVRDELDAIGVAGFPKTSGAAGLHIYVPMPPDTPYDAGRLFCQIISTVVAQKHRKLATVDRAVKSRGRRVYVDFLQNRLGSTLASAYSPRANDFAGVSTPLAWTEVDEGVSPKDFTIRTFPARFESVGDLWAGLRKAKGADLTAAMRYGKGTKGLGDEGTGR